MYMVVHKAILYYYDIEGRIGFRLDGWATRSRVAHTLCASLSPGHIQLFSVQHME